MAAATWHIEAAHGGGYHEIVYPGLIKLLPGVLNVTDARRASMRRTLTLLAAAVVVLCAVSSVPAQSLDPRTRAKLDQELASANGVGDLLHVANTYAAAGYIQQAKAVIDRAAGKASSGMEWQGIAGAYQRLGYHESAEAALRKAREASR